MINPYCYLFYIIYKCVKLTTKSDLQDLVPESTNNAFVFGATNYYLTFIIVINPFQYVNYNFNLFAVVFIIPIAILYFLNKKLLISNEKYKQIEVHFDKTNKLKKIHFILITGLYMFGSIAAMIWAGINYSN